MKIKFLGAAGTVTGSGYVVTANNGEQILIDLGMFQGLSDIDELNYKPVEIEVKRLVGAVLTHAHLDHCGRLPVIRNMGYTKDIYMTAPTTELTQLTLMDSAKIAKEDHPGNVLYYKDQVMEFASQFKAVEYDKTFSVGGFKVTLRDAGHIIGSASVEVEADGRKIVFSGDLGNTPEDLTEPTEAIRSADIVVMESTYGDRLHPVGEAIDIIRAEINAIEASGSALLIPAFSLERTQEILHIISHLKSKGLVLAETPVYMDSPMAEKATNIYEKYKDFLNDEIRRDFMQSDPFDFPGLVEIRDRKDSAKINNTFGAKVIIAGGGMMTGGRIVDHARYFLPINTTRLLIVGFQGEGTLGRQILMGEKEVVIDKQKVFINATVSDTQVMSSHADQPRLLNWLKNINGVKKIILTHGEDGPRATLGEKIKTDLGIQDVSLPTLNQELEV